VIFNGSRAVQLHKPLWGGHGAVCLMKIDHARLSHDESVEPADPASASAEWLEPDSVPDGRPWQRTGGVPAECVRINPYCILGAGAVSNKWPPEGVTIPNEKATSIPPGFGSGRRNLGTNQG
jgi:hypothetical protein